MMLNSTLKLKAVALLLGLHFAQPTLAIGLGDLSVHSHLEQPLHATVMVLSAPSTLDIDCLSLSAGNNGLPAPAQARFRIERTGENVLLHITTQSPVSDPIAQFVLTSDCEGRLQREYVLLLDPPPQIEPVRLAETQTEQAVTGASAPAATVSIPASPAAKSTSIKQSAQVTPRAAPPQARRAATHESKTPTASPRLVISGKTALYRAGSLPAGRETDAAPTDQLVPGSATLTSTELSDENTALNRRLAHLESQLAALSKRNAELEAQFAATSLAAPTPVGQHGPQWPLNLLGFGLLASSGALVAWMRRHREVPRSEAASTIIWTRPINAMPAKIHVDRESPSPQLDPMLQNDSPKPSTTVDPDLLELPLSALAESTDVKDDILIQAEVYVAHGHPNMAINALQEYLHDAPAESPVPWLLLLDLLLREGDEAGYAEASAACRRHFNVHFSAHPMSQDQDDNQGLEAYPHILEMLTHAWNTPGIHAVFKDLIYDQRHGARMGFEPGAYRDILLLHDIAQEKNT